MNPAETLHQQANVYAKNNDYDNALKCYHEALQLAPSDADIHYHLGLLFLKNHQIDYAKIQFNNVLSIHPQHPIALFHLGTVLLLEQDFEAAEHVFQEALSLNPNDKDTLNNLGVIAIQLNRPQEAIDTFSKVLLLDENNLTARHNLASLFMHHSRYENALMHYDVVLSQKPNDIECLYNSGVAEMALGHLDKAKQYLETVLHLNAQHIDSLINLAAVFHKQGDKISAQRYLNQALQLNNEHPIARHLINALTEQPNAKTYPTYSENLFDNYAVNYESHLVSTLKYSLPDVIEQHLLMHPKHNQLILELGCGTGLMGKILATNTDELIGVDISKNMLSLAKEKQIYQALIHQEIIAYLTDKNAITGPSHAADLIITADVLPYFGDLEPIFANIKSHLTKNGQWILTIEASEKQESSNFYLDTSARFKHSLQYIEELCLTHHYLIVDKKMIEGRVQDGVAVKMWFMVLASMQF